MNFILMADNKEVAIKRFNFSAGEVQVRLLSPENLSSECVPEDISNVREWSLTAHVRCSDDIMALLMIRDAIRQTSLAPVHLRLPYLPYSRQDRAVYRGEAHALGVMGKLLLQAEFSTITTWDMHSAVGHYAIPGIRNIPASQFIGPALLEGEVVVAPDSGAVRRAAECAGDDHALVKATKVRDPDTGNLRDPEVSDDFDANADLIIVDDICDGGRTFLQLGRVLRTKTSGRLRLYVTHGIFSNGVEDLLRVFDEILTANLFNDTYADRVMVLPLSEALSPARA